MPPPMSKESYQELIRAIQDAIGKGGKINGRAPSAYEMAGKALGLSTGAVKHRARTGRAQFGYWIDDTPPPARGDLEFPDFPPEDIPVERLIDLAAERFEARKASFAAHTWFPIKVKSKLPIGIMWFGDPHLDDNGCDWTQLKRHVEICKATEGLYGANIGDTTNNWVGRLARLYAEQDASISTARKFAQWFLLDSGVTWMLVILGNHDAWGDGAAIISEMAKRFGTHKLVVHDWEARFSLAFPNGWAPKIFASHDFKGNSIWNPMHGPMREGQKGDDADLYVAGHKHESGHFTHENPARGHIQHFLRVRGFKFLDQFARHHGYKEQKSGCSGVTIFDPQTRAISVFLDVEEGADVLTFKRRRADG